MGDETEGICKGMFLTQFCFLIVLNLAHWIFQNLFQDFIRLP